jgi:hypothetical protein
MKVVIFFFLSAEMISSFFSTCDDGCCIKIANNDYKRKRKNEFGKSSLQQCFYSQISGPTIRYSLKFEMKLNLFFNLNEKTKPTHTKTLFQFVAILQMCKPRIWTVANARYFSMKTINITYSYGSIFVTHINWLWGPLKFFFFLFSFFG